MRRYIKGVDVDFAANVLIGKLKDAGSRYDDNDQPVPVDNLKVSTDARGNIFVKKEFSYVYCVKRARGGVKLSMRMSGPMLLFLLLFLPLFAVIFIALETALICVPFLLPMAVITTLVILAVMLRLQFSKRLDLISAEIKEKRKYGWPGSPIRDMNKLNKHAVIVVQKKQQMFDVLTDYNIYIDRRRGGSISREGRVKIPVEPGWHTLQVRSDSISKKYPLSSWEVEFYARPDKRVEFTCHRKPWYLFGGWFGGIRLDSRSYIWLTRKN